MILAAGLGTRLKPFTDKHPKALALVNGKTLLQRNIEYLKAYGVNEVVVNVHHFADQIIEHIHSNHQFGITIHISDETDVVLETGGGLQKAAPLLEGEDPFVLMNVDILTKLNINEMWQQHMTQKPIATLAVSDRVSSRCFLFNEDMQLCGWKNRNTEEVKMAREANHPKEFAFSGLHIISPQIFSLIKQVGKFSMVDVYLDLARQHTIQAYDHSGIYLLDVGKPESIAEAEKHFE